MNGQRTQLRTGVFIVILVLGVVLIWWGLIVPRTPQFKAYKRKTEIRARLYNVERPRGVRIDSLDAMEIRSSRDSSKDWTALATYSGLIDCDAVIAHYKQQFPKNGFTLTEEKEDTQKHERVLTFIANDYKALLTCKGRELPQPYRILMLPERFHRATEVRQ